MWYMYLRAFMVYFDTVVRADSANIWLVVQNTYYLVVHIFSWQCRYLADCSEYLTGWSEHLTGWSKYLTDRVHDCPGEMPCDCCCLISCAVA